MSHRIEEYKGHKILIIDFSGLRGQEYLDGIEAVEKEVLSHGKGELCALMNVEGTYSTDEITDRFKLMAERTQGYMRGKTAAIGVTGMKRVIANMMKRDMYFAKSIEDGKEWLVKNT